MKSKFLCEKPAIFCQINLWKSAVFLCCCDECLVQWMRSSVKFVHNCPGSLQNNATLYHIRHMERKNSFVKSARLFFSMSNLPKVPNLFCDPRENLQKLALNISREKLPGISSEAFAHGLLFFILCEPHENMPELRSQCMKSLKWKQITHVL